MQHVDSKYKCGVYDSSTVCFFMLINSCDNDRLIICIDLFLRQPSWRFFLFKPDQTGRPWSKTVSCGFWWLYTWWRGYSLHFQRGLLWIIHSSVTYKLACYSTGGIRNLRALRNVSSFIICDSIKEDCRSVHHTTASVAIYYSLGLMQCVSFHKQKQKCCGMWGIWPVRN